MRAALNSLLSPATITTTLGALVAIGVGLADAWGFGHAFGANVDLALVLSGITGLLGHNPTVPPA